MPARFLRYCFFGLAALALVLNPCYSQGNSQGQGKGHQKHKKDRDDEDDQGGRGGKTRVRIVFGAHDRELISRYYTHRNSNLPPGLAKRGGNLPPGLEKHLERDGTLPPGLQKRVQPCPEELERQLPRLPAGYRRVVLGAHIMIVNRNTNVIVDILKDVAR
ncbi:MAG: hypothetical protein LAN61_01795 [Acidobacteriia bacterium]|nr:hypothetical protein [Terriglobia bacterium]